MRCWICNTNEATTAEHLVKASDVRSFGKITQNTPAFLYKSSNVQMPILIGSAKSDRLKSSKLLCGYCNNTRTQPYDDAWNNLSQYLTENWSRIRKQGKFDLSKIDKFRGQTKKAALYVHLYFVKLFGCRIIDDNISIDIKSFSCALMSGQPHDEIFLFIGENPYGSLGCNNAGISAIKNEYIDNKCVRITFAYYINEIAIEIRCLAREFHAIDNLKNAWHPSTGHKIVKIKTFPSPPQS